jgi:hypothetical protein
MGLGKWLCCRGVRRPAQGGLTKDKRDRRSGMLMVFSIQLQSSPCLVIFLALVLMLDLWYTVSVVVADVCGDHSVLTVYLYLC